MIFVESSPLFIDNRNNKSFPQLHFLFDNSAGARTSHYICSFGVPFLDIFHCMCFQGSFLKQNLDIQVFLQWLMAFTMSAAVEMRQISKQRLRFCHENVFFVFLSGAIEDCILRKLDNQQLQQMLMLMLGPHRHCEAHDNLYAMFRINILA